MNESEEFAKLRGLLSNSLRDNKWSQEFCRLLKRVSKVAPSTYRELWLPYCTEHRHLLSGPIRRVFSIDELIEWSVICPFATFSLYCGTRTICDAIEGYQAAPLQYVSDLYIPLTGPIGHVGEQVYCAISGAQSLAGLRSLSIFGATTQVGCEALATSPYIRRLQTLYLRSSRMGVEGIEVFAQSDLLLQLEELGLQRAMLGDRGLEILLQSAYLTRVARLNLQDNQLTSQGLRSLLQSSYVQQIEVLILDGNTFGDAGCCEFEKVDALPALRELYMLDCGIQEEGAAVLTNARCLQQLEVFQIWPEEEEAEEEV